MHTLLLRFLSESLICSNLCMLKCKMRFRTSRSLNCVEIMEILGRLRLIVERGSPKMSASSSEVLLKLFVVGRVIAVFLLSSYFPQTVITADLSVFFRWFICFRWFPFNLLYFSFCRHMKHSNDCLAQSIGFSLIHTLNDLLFHRSFVFIFMIHKIWVLIYK